MIAAVSPAIVTKRTAVVTVAVLEYPEPLHSGSDAEVMRDASVQEGWPRAFT